MQVTEPSDDPYRAVEPPTVHPQLSSPGHVSVLSSTEISTTQHHLQKDDIKSGLRGLRLRRLMISSSNTYTVADVHLRAAYNASGTSPTTSEARITSNVSAHLTYITGCLLYVTKCISEFWN